MAQRLTDSSPSRSQSASTRRRWVGTKGLLVLLAAILVPSSSHLALGDAAAPNGRFVTADSDSCIYAVAQNGNLLYYKHAGWSDGAFNWSHAGAVIGSGWGGFKRIFAGGGGVIYAITTGGNLLWYKHTGRTNGTADWATGSGNVVGTGWTFNQVFASNNGDGVIYAVANNGDLLWYKHTGISNGTGSWAGASGSTVGYTWNGLSRLSAQNGTIYGVASNGDLLWYNHTGSSTGAFTWGSGSGNQVGISWAHTTIMLGATGRIYAITDNLDLLWYNHLGASDGSFSWDNSPQVVGYTWDFLPVAPPPSPPTPPSLPTSGIINATYYHFVPDSYNCSGLYARFQHCAGGTCVPSSYMTATPIKGGNATCPNTPANQRCCRHPATGSYMMGVPLGQRDVVVIGDGEGSFDGTTVTTTTGAPTQPAVITEW
jgi:hypothetical protein